MKKILNASFGCLLALCLLGGGTFSPVQAETVQKKESFQVGKQTFLLNGKLPEIRILQNSAVWPRNTACM